ncbi:sugar phosphate isomerase/epimerase family protein [Neobacillus dielmonensis]|uniref:sugar phosphate isomerase/epimerase family protein n=1 Tax=Neobacillus dielmonensis TaxID=1347369 RepID=UPI0005AB4979|nr:sugar phosphate isomerase/epimerase family protein [Neobacillus dielmonensis]
MKSLVSTFALRHLPIEESIAKLLENGWSSIEVMCEGFGYDMLDWDPTKRKELRRLLQHYGASINFHGPYIEFNPALDNPAVRFKTEEIWKKCMELVAFFNSEYILFHPGKSENHEQGIENIQQFYSEKIHDLPDGSLLLLENVPPYEKQIGTNSDDLIQILDAVHNEKIRVCFDTGHAFLANRDEFDSELQKLKPYIKGFHLNDNHGKVDEHLAIGDGEIPFESIMELISSKERDDFVNFEMSTLNDANQSREKVNRLLGRTRGV